MELKKLVDLVLFVMKQSIENADSLINESELLFDHGYFSRSYTLSHLASEELGKVLICFDEILLVCRSGEGSKKAFRRRFSSHKLKIEYIHTFDYISTRPNINEKDGNLGKSWLKSGKDPQYISESNKVKNMSLYVDIHSDYKVVIPNKCIPKELSFSLMGLTSNRYKAILEFYLFTKNILKNFDRPMEEVFREAVKIPIVKEHLDAQLVELVVTNIKNLDKTEALRAFPITFFETYPRLRELFKNAPTNITNKN